MSNVVSIGKKESKERKRFFAMLEKFPRISGYWDREKAELDIDRLKSAIASMSAGEQAVARFLAGVWLNDNIFGFDVIEHSKDFGIVGWAIFKEWVDDPFYP